MNDIDEVLRLNPIDVTPKGGLNEPMHSWYPLIQGYSSSFVRKIINYFEPSSKRILDPFSGTGTTSIETFRMGKEAFYCELNPLLQFITDVKVRSLLLDDPSRQNVSEALNTLAVNYKTLLNSFSTNSELELSYIATFGQSRFFFFADVLNNVLKARTVIDEMSYSEPLIADYLLVATLSSLIPSSLLIRAGDLRFRRSNEIGKIKEFESSVSNNLIKIANDIAQLRIVNSSKPLLLCEDSRHLSSINPLQIDAIITSPPYINGTNYFRNTKVELWFLRCLHSSKDLKNFRIKTVATGINSVLRSKKYVLPNSPTLHKIVAELKQKAYDKRIPILIENYFADLSEIFSGVSTHLRRDGLLAVDIGDSIFAGVHIPTDRILLEILQKNGLEYKTKLQLRKRRSRNGTPLGQFLLILRNNNPKSVLKRVQPFWSQKWKIFKDQMPHQKRPFSKRNWGNPLHSLCSYEGKMKPALANHLISIFVPKGSKMLDPFAGVGTIPFEAALKGIESYGFEISPFAFYIAAAKVSKPNRKTCLEIIESLKKYIKRPPDSSELEAAKQFGFNRTLSEYYHPDTLREIVQARQYFQENRPSNPSEYLIVSCLLHILHGNRPYALSRRSHPITPYAPSGPFEYRPLIPRLVKKVNRSLLLTYPTHFIEGKIFYQDSTSWWPTEVDQLDAIVTSPPFFDSTRFYMKNWLRLWFSGWEKDDFKTKPTQFIDKRQKRSFEVYESIFRQAQEQLQENGVMVLHLGESKKCDMAKELSQIASKWFTVEDLFKESVQHLESHGSRDKGTVKKHQYLILT